MKRWMLVLMLAALILLVVTAPASANPVETIYNKLLGCEGKLQWPCPGPVIW